MIKIQNNYVNIIGIRFRTLIIWSFEFVSNFGFQISVLIAAFCLLILNNRFNPFRSKLKPRPLLIRRHRFLFAVKPFPNPPCKFH